MALTMRFTLIGVPTVRFRSGSASDEPAYEANVSQRPGHRDAGKDQTPITAMISTSLNILISRTLGWTAKRTAPSGPDCTFQFLPPGIIPR